MAINSVRDLKLIPDEIRIPEAPRQTSIRSATTSAQFAPKRINIKMPSAFVVTREFETKYGVCHCE
jgi:hypothetical protein